MINLLYTDSEIMNLLTWGVEGVDYELVDGQVQHVEDSHYYEADFLIGNNLLLTPLYGNGADFYERVKTVVSNAELSPYLGFAVNTGDLDLTISQLTAVNDQYQASFYCGLYTPELYQDFLSKLEAAGVQEYLDLCGIAAFLLLILSQQHELLYYIAGVLYGFFGGLTAPALNATAINASPADRKGAASATFQAPMEVAFTVSSIAGGMVIDAFDSYTVLFVISSAFAALALVLSFLFFLPRRRA